MRRARGWASGWASVPGAQVGECAAENEDDGRAREPVARHFSREALHAPGWDEDKDSDSCTSALWALGTSLNWAVTYPNRQSVARPARVEPT